MRAVVPCITLALSSCGAGPMVTPAEVSMSDSHVIQARDRADVVFLARILELRPAPTGWSGFVETWQEVSYEVVQVFKGELRAGEQISVRHRIVARSRTAADQPGLRKDWFVVGGRLVVFARRDAAGWSTVDEEQGVMLPMDPLLTVLGR